MILFCPDLSNIAKEKKLLLKRVCLKLLSFKYFFSFSSPFLEWSLGRIREPPTYFGSGSTKNNNKVGWYTPGEYCYQPNTILWHWLKLRRCVTVYKLIGVAAVLRSRSFFDRLQLQVLFFTGSGSFSYKNSLKNSKKNVFAFTSSHRLRLRPKSTSSDRLRNTGCRLPWVTLC